MLDDTTASWPLKPLSEIVDLNPRLDKSGYQDDLNVSFVPMAAVEAGSGRIEVSQTRHFSTVKKGYTPFREGDVLFAKITPCMENGKMAVVPKLTNGVGFGSTEFHVLRPRPGIEPRYVYHFVSNMSFRREAAHHMTGAVGQKRVPTSFLEDAAIPVPPFDQQQRLVAEIEKQFSRLDEAVANLKRVKANLKRYKASVLKAAVEGRLTEDWRKQHPNAEPASKLLERILAERRKKWNGRGKYKEPVGPEASNLPLLPKGWTWAVVEQLGVVQLGRQRSPKNRSKDYAVRYIRAANITETGLDLSDLLDMEFSPQEQERYRLMKGDLVLSEASGSPRQVGKPAVWRDQLPLCCFQNTVIRLRPTMDLSPYLLKCFQSYFVNGVFAKIAGGVGINHLSAEKFSKITIPLAPVPEQQQILAEVDRRLSVVAKLEATVEANLTRADRLRQSILSQAFNGKLLSNGAHG